MKISAGLVLYKDDEFEKKILLLHPTNSPWIGRFSIPKGLVDPLIDTDYIDTAIRETYEECGIVINRQDVNTKEHYVDYYKNNDTKHLNIYKRVYFYIVDVTKYNLPDILPTNQLQLEEVDYACFYYELDAMNIIFKRFKNIFNLV